MLSGEAFAELVRQRTRCRAYAAKPVPRALLEQMLEAARLAPSACNRQPWRFAVVQEEHTSQPIAMNVPCYRINMRLGKASRFYECSKAKGNPPGCFGYHALPRFGCHSSRMVHPAGAKFTYIRLNMPIPCPPRSAVPVNRPFLTGTGVGSYSGFKLGQACDFPKDVDQEVSS